jgi:ABC-type bacteriocin/lantibiotic exporter with double-glycine peptidase domain
MTATIIMAWFSVSILLIRIIWVRIMLCIMYIFRKLFGTRNDDHIHIDHRVEGYDIYADYNRIKDYMILR